jgi:putative OPT family oligopeptide transporter
MTSTPTDSSHEPPVEPTFTDDREAARWWLANVYAGDDAVQLTPRAVIFGMLIGGLMSISNLYVGLKTGWGMPVTITSCIIAYAVFSGLERIVPPWRKRHFTILENYTMSSAASAAGYMSSAGLVAAVPSLYLATERQLTPVELGLWLGGISVLGVFMAIPLKRQLINIDRLPFPSGIATATTLRGLHATGAAAVAQARALVVAALVGGGLIVWRDVLAKFERLKAYALPADFPLIPGEAGKLIGKYTFGIESSVLLVAAGAIMGLRVAISLLVGAIVCFGIIGPILVAQGIVEPGFGAGKISSWTLWPASSMMVASGLLSFGFRWRTIVRAVSGLGRLAKGGGVQNENDPLARVEVPMSWFVIGTLASGAACVLLGHWLFDISLWMGVVAVLLTFLLSIVAARATGETDVTPNGAMGKITQLIYGVLAPSNITTNIMTASLTAGASCHSADLLTDLKTGHLLGGNPRKQMISQLFGVIAGTIICVPAYQIVVANNPKRLGTPDFPATAAQVWASVAKVLANGYQALPPGALWAIVIGAAIGIILTTVEEFSPPHVRKWLPSTIGLGIGGINPAANSISMFAGALLAWLFARTAPKTAMTYTVLIASGLIAGESLVSVAVIVAVEALHAAGWL